MSNDKTSRTSVKRSTASDAAEQRRLLIDIDDLTVQFSGEVAIDRISACIHEGEFIGLIGPNGAGKTTLLRVLLGLQAPSSGKITRDHSAIGYVPQRTRSSEMQLPIGVHEVVGLSRPRPDAILSALAEVGMADTVHRRFGELSGGQQQRVLIAKALAARPALLILDEPTTGIDEAAQRDFFAILERLSAGGLTIVMVSHDVEAVMAQANRVICLNRRVLYDGPLAGFELEAVLPEMYGSRHQALHHHHELKGGSHA